MANCVSGTVLSDGETATNKQTKTFKGLRLHEIYILVGHKDKSKINTYDIWCVGGRPSRKCGCELFASRRYQESSYRDDL